MRTATPDRDPLRTECHHLTAAGVLTGQLVDADGTAVAVGSRRHTAAAELVSDQMQHVVRIGPLRVDVAGFMVSVPEIEVIVPRVLRAGR